MKPTRIPNRSNRASIEQKLDQLQKQNLNLLLNQIGENDAEREDGKFKQLEDFGDDEAAYAIDLDLTSEEWENVNPIELQKRYDVIRRYVS